MYARCSEIGLSLFASSFEVIAHCERPLSWPWPLREHGCIWALAHSHATAVLSTNRVFFLLLLFFKYIFITRTLNHNGLSAPFYAGSAMLLFRPLIFLCYWVFLCVCYVFSQLDLVFFLISLRVMCPCVTQYFI